MRKPSTAKISSAEYNILEVINRKKKNSVKISSLKVALGVFKKNARTTAKDRIQFKLLFSVL